MARSPPWGIDRSPSPEYLRPVVHSFRAHLRQQCVGYVALFVALSGTAYAAATIGPAQIKNDAVRSRHVKDGEVKNADLGANSVATGKVLNGTLLKQDFKAGQIPPAVPPTEPVRLVRQSSNLNCLEPPRTQEFCRNGDRGWTNYEDGYQPAGFYKDRSGIVHLEGSVVSLGHDGSDPLPVFVLPPGYRPTGGARAFGVFNSTAQTKLGGLKITSDGSVLPENPHNADYLTLDGIQFRP